MGNHAREDGAQNSPISAAIAEPREALIGRVIGERYKILRAIGHGGMGKVYQAEQTPLGRSVALKVLSPSLAAGENDASFRQRFFLEASVAARLSHPNTVRIFDYGKTEDGIYYIAMELLQGRTLQQALKDEGPFAAARSVRIAEQICRSLRQAHDLAVVHRDLKPSNIFLLRSLDDGDLADTGEAHDFAKILDFGLVKDLAKDEHLTQTGQFMGSPKYMSPEQICTKPVHAQTDVYSLGVIMYEMLTGQTPFGRSNSVDTFIAHVQERVPPMKAVNPGISVPAALEELVRCCLAKNPDDRPAGMQEVLLALQASITASPSGAVSASKSLQEESGTVQSASGERALRVAAPFAQASRSGGNAGALLLACLFAFTGVGGLIVLARPFEQSSTLTDAVAPGASQEILAVTQATSASAQVLVTLRSMPPGATVFLDGREYGPTPTHLVLRGSEANEGRELMFRFRLPGYYDTTVVRQIRGARLDIHPPPLEPLEQSVTRAGARAAFDLPVDK
jgi:serine/threonine protein kinase